jgi:hypothetical protein
MEDWRQTGTAASIYSTPLGVELSMGDMHSGTTFDATIALPSHVADEIETAWREHGAYPVLRLMPNKRVKRTRNSPRRLPLTVRRVLWTQEQEK